MSGLGNKCFLAVLAIVKNEALSIQEWCEHYLWQGVDHFFIIDNGSTDNTVELIQNSINQQATIVRRPGRLNQTQFLNGAYKEFRNATDWMAVIDADEFWYGHSQKLSDVVRKREQDGFSSIFTNWKHFGSMGFQKQPESIRQSLTRRGHTNTSVFDGKCVFKTKSTSEIGVHSHSTQGRQIRDNYRLSLNHYRIQSDEFFNIKIARGGGPGQWIGKKTPLVNNGLSFNWFVRDWDHYRELHDINEIEDTTLRDLVLSGYGRPAERE